MGLTGGVKSHRLPGQISPYCEKKRHWLCAYCAPMFLQRQGALPAAAPPKETKILLHKRQPENKHHSDGEEICATEVAPKYASHSTQLPVTGKEQSSLVIAGRI